MLKVLRNSQPSDRVDSVEANLVCASPVSIYAFSSLHLDGAIIVEFFSASAVKILLPCMREAPDAFHFGDLFVSILGIVGSDSKFADKFLHFIIHHSNWVAFELIYHCQ